MYNYNTFYSREQVVRMSEMFPKTLFSFFLNRWTSLEAATTTGSWQLLQLGIL